MRRRRRRRRKRKRRRSWSTGSTAPPLPGRLFAPLAGAARTRMRRCTGGRPRSRAIAGGDCAAWCLLVLMFVEDRTRRKETEAGRLEGRREEGGDGTDGGREKYSTYASAAILGGGRR